MSDENGGRREADRILGKLGADVENIQAGLAEMRAELREYLAEHAQKHETITVDLTRIKTWGAMAVAVWGYLVRFLPPWPRD